MINRAMAIRRLEPDRFFWALNRHEKTTSSAGGK